MYNNDNDDGYSIVIVLWADGVMGGGSCVVIYLLIVAKFSS